MSKLPQISRYSKSKKIYIHTFGCQMNEHDSEQMAGLLEFEGFSLTDEMEKADLILINSCAIRKKAEEKAFSEAGRLKELKRLNPDIRIGFCGCVAQREKEKIFKRATYIDLLFGTLNISDLPDMLKRLWHGEKKICQFLDEPVSMKNHSNHCLRLSKIKAWVTIMEGCNNFCSYCVVPYVRGRERSRSPDDIIEEVNLLAKSGYKEVTLLGQNVNSYGKGMNPPSDFPSLLHRLNEIEGLERIRFVTSHPKDLSMDLVFAIRDCKKVCDHIHLPLQSGSNAVLKKMGRCYTVEEYLYKVSVLRDCVPGISLTGDIICGFPGETDRDFEKTLDVIECVRYDGLFSFKYSDRPQTSASKMPDHIPEIVKAERLQRLQTLQNRICSEINSEMVDSELPVLIEGYSKMNPRKLTGRTRTNKVVNLEGTKEIIGRTVMVKITCSKKFNLEGEVIQT
ncbi:tRNA (N6-isopentenyl adenosine(37)-C2)-methylthiotransferase MiaB [bacterium]|nr:tRNA (N6-isopentenyl adenosine(37)-C2)-methylthiotransferase MiaB [bacterium]